MALHSYYYILSPLDCWLGVCLRLPLTTDSKRIPEVLHSSLVAAPSLAPVTKIICLQKVQEPWKGERIKQQEEERERVRQFWVNGFFWSGWRRGHNKMDFWWGHYDRNFQVIAIIILIFAVGEKSAFS